MVALGHLENSNDIRFMLIKKVNDLEKTQKASNGLGKAQKLQGEFWQAFGEYGASNEEYSKEFNKIYNK